MDSIFPAVLNGLKIALTWVLAPLAALPGASPEAGAGGLLVSLAMIAGLIFLAALVRGLAGFGFPLVALSGLALFYPPAFVVPLIVILQAGFGVIDLARIRRQADWPLLSRVVVGSLVGAPLGVVILLVVPEAYLRMIIGLLIMLASYVLLRGFTLKTRPGTKAQLGTGVVCGFMHGAAAMSGPPAVFMLLASQTDPNRARATLFALYALVAWVAIISMRLAGAVDLRNLALGLALLPLMFAGFEAGKALYARLQPQMFRPIATLVLMATGFVLLLKSALAEFL